MPTLVDEMGPLAAVLQAVTAFEAEQRTGQPTLKVSILRNYTVEAIEPLLKYLAFKSSLDLKLTIGEYDNVRQEVLNEGSHVYASQPDIVVLSLLIEHLDAGCLRSNWNPANAREAVLSTLSDLVERSRALVMVNLTVAADSRGGCAARARRKRPSHQSNPSHQHRDPSVRGATLASGLRR